MDPEIPKLKITTPPLILDEGKSLKINNNNNNINNNDKSSDSLDTLASQLQNSSIHEDTDDQSLNNDLASVSKENFPNSLVVPSSIRQSFDSSSIFTSSFRQSFDDFGANGSPLLGNNQSAAAAAAAAAGSCSPLGANSIYELVADVDTRKAQKSTLNGGINIMKPTQMDIQPVIIPKVVKADKEVAKKYLNEIKGEFEKFDSNKKLTSSSLKKISDHIIDDLTKIPKIYFQNEFNLDDPRIFKQVLEGFKLRQLNQENSLLQEKLSSYLDIVEVHLVKEISKSSGSFFDALNDLTDIQLKNTIAINNIDELKSNLNKLNQGKIQIEKRKFQLLQKRENVAKFEQVLLQMITIKHQLTTAHELFYQSEYEKCLDKLDQVDLLIRGESNNNSNNNLNWPYQLINLNLLPAMQSIHKSIKSLKLKVGESFIKIFIDYLINDLRSNYEELNHGQIFSDLIQNKRQTKNLFLDNIKKEFKDELTNYLEGLVRCEVITEALIQYQNQILIEMKNIVRMYLPNEEKIKTGSTSSMTTNSKVNGTASLGQLIKSLTPKEFEYVLIQIIITSIEGFKRLKIHQKLLLELTLNSNKVSISNDLVASLDINPAINKSIEIVQLRIGKVLKVRIDLNSMLRYDYFLRLFFINSTFINVCESISGLGFKELPFILNELVKGFNSTTFGNYKGKCIQSVDQEKWSPCIVEIEIQEKLNKITEKINFDDEKNWQKDLISFLLSKDSQDSVNQIEKSNKRSLVVGDKMFVASQTLLTYFAIIYETLLISSNLPQLSQTYENFSLDLARTFTTRISQSITLKDGKLNKDSINLSVVGETLDCLVEILLFIRLWFDNQRFGEEYEKTINIIKSLKTKIENASILKMEE